MKLHVEDSGQGAPVLLLHSSGLSGRQWRRLASALVEHGTRAVVPDLTGHGKSPEWPEPRPFSFDVDVEEVVELLGSLDTPAHLVGHSYGGFLALLVTLAVPGRVRSLVLYEPVAFGVLDRTADADALDDLRRVPLTWDALSDRNEQWLAAFVDYWGGPGAWGALREDARNEFRRVAWVLYRGVNTLATDRTPAAAYAAIRCPVQLMTGEQSTVAAHRVVQRLGEVLPGTRTVVVPHVGHMGPLTHADAVNPSILDWVTACCATPSPSPSSGA